ncbi:MAG: PrsW family glutamic-type intramembrane protease [Candidatus Paceibacterota bacterium]
MISFTLPTLVYAFFGGLLPALLWLWFFNHEDPHPEPRSRLIETFMAGMLTVFIAMVIQGIIQDFAGGQITSEVLLGWAFVEEALKFAAAWIVALRMNVFDEPIDAMIYLITVALGFAAMENSLFLLIPVSEAAYLSSFLSGGLRFVGATLVHVVSSGVMGALIAASYYRNKRIRHEFTALGLIAATLLHWGFNLLIMGTAQATILQVFAFVWVAVIILMLVFEGIKRMQKKKTVPYPFT